MRIKTSSGFEYSYDPIDNSIVDEKDKGLQNFHIRFKPLEEISNLPNISSFTIGVTEQCNFRCSYCCYSGLYSEHRTHSVNRLKIEAIPSIVKFMIDVTTSKNISIDFYGGESLLEFEWIKKFVSYIDSYKTHNWSFELSTNGLLLSNDVCDWLIKHDFKVFVSLDGIGDFHDKCRKDIHRHNTFSAIYNNLSYIKSKDEKFWMNNIQIMMTIQDISKLPEIAEQWESSSLLFNKMPYRISEVSTIYNDKTAKIDFSDQVEKYVALVQWYKTHPNSLFMKTFFSLWLAEWINRPIMELDGHVEYPTCIPQNRKLYIDTNKRIGICERISDSLRIGTIEDGICFDKVNEIAKSTAAFMAKNCANCEIARLCDVCPDILKISGNVIDIYCHNQKAMQRVKFQSLCELAEADFIQNLWE